MKSRLIVAAIGIPLLLGVLCVLPPFATALLFAAVCCIGVHELFHVQGLGDRKAAMVLCMVSAAAVQALVLLWGYGSVLYLILPFLVLLFLLWDHHNGHWLAVYHHFPVDMGIQQRVEQHDHCRVGRFHNHLGIARHAIEQRNFFPGTGKQSQQQYPKEIFAHSAKI